MSKIIAHWPLCKTKSKEALTIVSSWVDDDSVRSYLVTIFPHVSLIRISNLGDACKLAAERFGPKHLQFFERSTYYDSSRGEMFRRVEECDVFEQFDPSTSEFVDPVKVVIETSAKWSVYPIEDNKTHTNFYFADLNPATEFKLKFN